MADIDSWPVLPARRNLGDLVRSAKITFDVDDYGLAARMPVDPVTGKPSPGHKLVEKWRNLKQFAIPHPTTIKNFAAGTDYTPGGVLMAAAESVDMRLPPLLIHLAFIADLEVLTDGEVGAILALVQAQVESRVAQVESQHQSRRRRRAS